IPLVLLLKLWMILPRSGQPQSMVSASAACAGLVEPTGASVATVDSLAELSSEEEDCVEESLDELGFSPDDEEDSAAVVTFSTWPTFSSPGSTIPFNFDNEATFISLLFAMLYKVSPRLTT